MLTIQYLTHYSDSSPFAALQMFLIYMYTTEVVTLELFFFFYIALKINILAKSGP